jgi:hypothetical protein
MTKPPCRRLASSLTVTRGQLLTLESALTPGLQPQGTIMSPEVILILIAVLVLLRPKEIVWHL